MLFGKLAMLKSKHNSSSSKEFITTTTTTTNNTTPRNNHNKTKQSSSFSRTTRAAVERDLVRRTSAHDTYATAFTHQHNHIIVKRSQSGCPSLDYNPNMVTPSTRSTSSSRETFNSSSTTPSNKATNSSSTTPSNKASNNSSISSLNKALVSSSTSICHKALATSGSVSPGTATNSPPRSPRFREMFDDEDIKPPSPDSMLPVLVHSTSIVETPPPSSKSVSSYDTSGPLISQTAFDQAGRSSEDTDSLYESSVHNRAFDLLGSAIAAALEDPSLLLLDSTSSDISPTSSLDVNPSGSTTDARMASRIGQTRADGTRVDRVFHLPARLTTIPVNPPLYDPSVLAGYHWITPMVTTSRPLHEWGSSKRWICCQCKDAHTIVEQQLCSNLDCQHIRCIHHCKLAKHRH